MTTRAEPLVFCMAATPFDDDGKLDEQGLRLHLRRMIDAGNAVYLGSGGAGEGHALTLDELSRVYEIGVEECKGRVPVYANPPEARTGAEMLQVASQAVAAGVDVVQLYPVDNGHGMVPTYREQETYYRDLLDAIDHPTSISVHVAVGYVTPIPLLAALVADYPQVVAINVMGPPLGYVVELIDAAPRCDVYVPILWLLSGLPVGARGCLEAESNLAPRLCRSVVDHYLAGDMDAAGEAMANVARLSNIVNRWAPSTARWVKMGLKVLGLPGGNGVIRKPYVLPPDDELDAMAAAFDTMDLRRIEGLEPVGR
jgi:dihydrodipicolinate synthase/N-acetylneuraminate lyase